MGIELEAMMVIETYLGFYTCTIGSIPFTGLVCRESRSLIFLYCNRWL